MSSILVWRFKLAYRLSRLAAMLAPPQLRPMFDATPDTARIFFNNDFFRQPQMTTVHQYMIRGGRILSTNMIVSVGANVTGDDGKRII